MSCLTRITTFRSRWTLLSSAGFVLGFLSFGLIAAIATLFRPEALAQSDAFQFYESVDELPEALYETMYRYSLIQHLVMYPVFGAILGSAQAFALRKAIPRVWPWIAVTALGFLSILGLELVRRHIVIGPHPGPVEPIMIALGAGGLAGLFQWLYLRKIDLPSAKWLGWWIGGLVAGIILAAASLMGIGMLFGGAIQYLESNAPKLALGIELGIFGAIVGAVAGWSSGRALRSSLGVPDEQEAHSAPAA